MNSLASSMALFVTSLSFCTCPKTFQSRGKAITALVVGLFLFFTVSAPVYSQGKATSTYLAEAFVATTKNAATANNLAGFGYNEGISILGAWLKTGKNVGFDTQLTGGVQYLFLAGGDNDAQDVDLEIFDAKGNRLASDGRATPDASVLFTPRATATYTLRLTLVKSKRNVPCVCVATILRKGGLNVALNNLNEAAGNLAAVLNIADQVLRHKTKKRLDLYHADNQWSIFGSVLDKGQETTVTKVSLGNGHRLFIGVGDKQADVDLFLLDKTDKVVQQDTRGDRIAILGRDPTLDDGPHGLRIRNLSRALSVTMMAVFEDR
jgi:hypothetical protein